MKLFKDLVFAIWFVIICPNLQSVGGYALGIYWAIIIWARLKENKAIEKQTHETVLHDAMNQWKMKKNKLLREKNIQV